MFRHKTVLLVVAVAILVLTACAPITREGASAPAGDPLAGTSWVLSELNGQPVLADTTISLQFGAEGQASGTDGCNRYTTSYSAEGDAIQFSPNAAMTMMACPTPIMDQATAYMAALTTAATFAVDGDTLTLSDASGAPLAVFAAQSTDLAGSAWSVTAYNNGNQAVVGLIDGTELTAVFGADGTISGTSGCNNFSGGYTVDSPGAIQIGPLMSTMMACSDPEGIMEQEMQYLAALQTAATYRMEGDTMEMRTAEDALAAMFVRAPQE